MKFTTEYLRNPQLEQCPNCQGRGVIYTPFVAVPMEGTAAETKDIVFVCHHCEGTGVLNQWTTRRLRTLIEEANDEVQCAHGWFRIQEESPPWTVCNPAGYAFQEPWRIG